MDIKGLIDKYNLQKDDCWLFERKNKKTGAVTKLWIITHDACEKIMAIENIKLENIQVLNSEKDFARFLIIMSKGEVKIMSIGEADKSNSQSSYIGCIAEKRGIDRCILKLIDAYQYGVYSESENESFEKNIETQKETLPPKQTVGFTEWNEKREILFKMAVDYKDSLNDDEKLFFSNLRKDITSKKPYSNDQFLKDRSFVENIINRLNEGASRAFDEPFQTSEEDKEPEFLLEDEKINDDLPKGVI